MNLLLIILRLLHIVAGVFWAGSLFFMVSFMLPTAREAGPAGAPFMLRFARSSFVSAATGAGVVTVLAGIALMWVVSGQMGPGWFGSKMGITLSIGGLAAIIALGYGLLRQRPRMLRMGAIAEAIAASGGGPTDAQQGELASLQPEVVQGARLVAWLLAVSVVCMAVARYL